jgi:hypothetical protein
MPLRINLILFLSPCTHTCSMGALKCRFCLVLYIISAYLQRGCSEILTQWKNPFKYCREINCCSLWRVRTNLPLVSLTLLIAITGNRWYFCSEESDFLNTHLLHLDWGEEKNYQIEYIFTYPIDVNQSSVTGILRRRVTYLLRINHVARNDD